MNPENLPTNQIDDPVTVLYLALDYDGCINNPDYLPDVQCRALSVEEILENQSIVEINPYFWEYLNCLLKKYPQVKHIRFVPFSSRQTFNVDFQNSFLNDSESYFIALAKFEAHAKKLYEHIEVAVDPILTPDIHGNLPIGSAFMHAFEIVMTKTIMEQSEIASKEFFGVLSNDRHFHNKKDLPFLHCNRAVEEFPDQRIHVVILDDRQDIIDAIGNTYNNDLGKKAASAKVSLEVHHYLGDEENQKSIVNPSHFIQFTGNYFPDYKELFRTFWAKQSSWARFEDLFSGQLNHLTERPKNSCRFLSVASEKGTETSEEIISTMVTPR